MKKFLSFIFSKKFWLNKWTLTITSIVIIVSAIMLTYLYNPAFVPQFIKSTNKNLVDKIVGRELAKRIDETRDENGATSIRTLFNLNKEENLEKHCAKKEEREKEQEKCYQTYKNEEFSFSVKYPVGWEIKQVSDNFISFYPPDSSLDDKGDINLYIKNSSNKSMKEFYDGQNDVDLFSDAAGGFQEYTINGYQAVKFSNVQGLINTAVIVIVSNNNFIEIEDWGENHLEDGILDSIANSFKR